MEFAPNSIGPSYSNDYSWSFSEFVLYEGPKRHFNVCKEHFNNLRKELSLKECLFCLGESVITLIYAVPLLGHLAFLIEMVASHCFGRDQKDEKQSSPIDLIEHDYELNYPPQQRTTLRRAKRNLSKKLSTLNSTAVNKNQKYLRTAALAKAAHSISDDQMKDIYNLGINILPPESCLANPKQISDTMILCDYHFIDPATALQMMIATTKTEAFICFGTIQDSEIEWVYKDYKGKGLFSTVLNNGAKSLFQDSATIYEEAEQLINTILESRRLEGKKITVIGHCLNGTIATYIGLRKGWKVQTFNSFPLGQKLQNRIGEGNLAKAEKLVTHISVKGDFNDNPCCFGIINLVSRIFYSGSSSKPGKHLIIPAHKDFALLSFFEKQYSIHNKFNKSLADYCNKNDM